MKRLNRFLLGFITAASVLTGGNVYAGEELSRLPDGESVTEEEAVPANRTELTEKPVFEASDVKKLFIYAGSADGVELYLRGDDYRERIYRAHGIDPDESSSGDIAQREAAEAETAIARKAGEAAAVYTESGKAAAGFKLLCTEDGTARYISEAECFIADVSVDTGKLVTLRRLVSSLDSDIAYIADGGSRLDLMDSSKKTCETSLTYSGESDGKRVYRNGTTGEFAWLSTDMRQYYGTFVKCAENDKLRLYADMRTSVMGLENRENGYIWWTSPLDSGHDPKANDTYAAELRSSSVLGFGIPEKRSDNRTLRSGMGVDCTLSAEPTENGIRVIYDYKREGFRYSVEYTLGEDYLRASLKTAEIEETGQGKIALRVTLLGSMGAYKNGEEGCFVIPDGSGALVRFGSKKSEGASPYLKRVYGNDVTAVPTTRGASDEQIYLPMYGIVKEDNALLAVAEKGDSNALLSVKTAEQSSTSFGTCNFVFTLRSTDTYYMTGTSSTSFTVFEKGGIKSDDIEMRYYPLSGKDCGYTDIAERYRTYLTEDKGVTVRAEENSAPLCVGLYGGVMKKRSFLGIPVSMRTSVTSYGQAIDILETLRSGGVGEMAVSYTNWTDSGIREHVDTKAKPSGKLGGKKAFSELKDYMESNSFELYPVSDNRDFRSGEGYYAFTDTAVRISGAYSRIVSYDLAYGIPDGFAKNKSLLSPDKFGEVYKKTAESYKKRGLDGISLSTMTSSLYGDYGKKSISRYDAMISLTECFARLDDTLSSGILADTANAYALPYVGRIMNVPVTSSRCDMFDEDIPFYQLVLHGVIPYSVPAVNSSPDPELAVLMAAATGSLLNYDLLWEDVSLLKDTEFDIYYYANRRGNAEKAAAAYNTLYPVLSKVSGCTITDLTADSGGSRITTVYSDGTEVTVDFEKKTVSSGGILYELGTYEGGRAS